MVFNALIIVGLLGERERQQLRSLGGGEQAVLVADGHDEVGAHLGRIAPQVLVEFGARSVGEDVRMFEEQQM